MYGNAAGQHDVAKQLARSGAERARRLEQIRIGVLYPGVGVDQDRHDRLEPDDDDLGFDAQAGPQDDERDERHARRGVQAR